MNRHLLIYGQPEQHIVALLKPYADKITISPLANLRRQEHGFTHSIVVQPDQQTILVTDLKYKETMLLKLDPFTKNIFFQFSMECCKKFVGPRKCIGPSKIAAVLGYNRWLSREQLKEQLEKGFWQEDNEAIRFGISNESLALKFYEKTRKTKLTNAPFVRRLNGRLVGKADSLIGENGGLEVKCHRNKPALTEIPLHYLVQCVAYMFMYKRDWWDFMSCGFQDGKLRQVKIIRIYWKNHSTTWLREWQPEIERFIAEVHWRYAS